MATTWDDLIRDYESTIVDIESWLEADDSSAAPAGWIPPAEPPTELPSTRQLERLSEVHDRDLALRERLESALSHTGRAVAAEAKRSQAARLYRSA